MLRILFADNKLGKLKFNLRFKTVTLMLQKASD